MSAGHINTRNLLHNLAVVKNHRHLTIV